ncbi:F0F1 ATP synthase subunit delta [Candidatus Gracilibacteria bacterium]|nr:F0F1 ATP synthase subunit delta [Candidatus Gracilibacteria bacterium]
MKITPRKYAQALALMVAENGLEKDKNLIQNFLKMLQRRKQMKLLPKIMKMFEAEWYKSQGVVQMQVQYPEKFPDSVKEFEKQMNAQFDNKVSIAATPSSAISGGLKVKIDDTLIDGTIEAKLQKLTHNLIHSK